MDNCGTPEASGPDLLEHRLVPAQSAATPTSEDVCRPRGYGRQMKYRRPVGVWLLALATLGGYGLFYWYRIHAELLQFDRRRHVSPGFELMSVFLLAWTIILPLMSVGSLAPKIRIAQSTAGLPQSCSGRRGILLALLLGAHVIYYQRRLNEIIAANAAGPGERIRLKV